MLVCSYRGLRTKLIEMSQNQIISITVGLHEIMTKKTDLGSFPFPHRGSALHSYILLVLSIPGAFLAPKLRLTKRRAASNDFSSKNRSQPRSKVS